MWLWELIKPLIGWYPLFGAVWWYLLMHEQVQKGRWKESVTENGMGYACLAAAALFFVSVLTWPYSVYCYFKSGKIKDMFE